MTILTLSIFFSVLFISFLLFFFFSSFSYSLSSYPLLPLVNRLPSPAVRLLLRAPAGHLRPRRGPPRAPAAPSSSAPSPSATMSSALPSPPRLWLPRPHHHHCLRRLSRRCRCLPGSCPPWRLRPLREGGCPRTGGAARSLYFWLPHSRTVPESGI